MTPSPCLRGTGHPDACRQVEDMCQGCGRTLREICSWGHPETTDSDRQFIAAKAKARLGRLELRLDDDAPVGYHPPALAHCHKSSRNKVWRFSPASPPAVGQDRDR